MKPFVVGITGGIASGKSVVSAKIQSLGGVIIDADIIAREVVQSGSEGEKLLKLAFPSAFCDGVLDRKALREIVFNDEDERNKLNNITHPLIEKRTRELIERSNESVVFLVVPLMFEGNFDKYCDVVFNVFAPIEKRVEWIKGRNSEITDDLAINMINAQTSDDVRNKRADEIINNDGSIEELEQKAVEIYKRYIKNKN